jgi:hypothetical protein
MHSPAKGRAGSSRGRLQIVLACSCALLLVLYAPRRRRTPVLNNPGQGDSDGGSSGAGDSSGGGGLLDRLIGEGPFAQSCQLIKDVCVDQVRAMQSVCLPVLFIEPPAWAPTPLPAPSTMLTPPALPALYVQRTAILYSNKYHPAPGRPAEALPVLEPPKRHRHYIFMHRETVRDGRQYSLQRAQYAVRAAWGARPAGQRLVSEAPAIAATAPAADGQAGRQAGRCASADKV